MEIIVPLDPPCRHLSHLQDRFPDVAFLQVEMDTQAARDGASREHHDSLRAAGMRAARGRLIALTEDHSVVGPSWCAEATRLTDQRPDVGAVGGPVDCRPRALLSFATWLCDFGRFGSPLPDGPVRYVSDTNVVYPRSALEQVPGSWRESYRETVIHDALRDGGRQLVLEPSLRSWQVREGLRMGPCLGERKLWGRSFAGTRVRDLPLSRRLPYAAFTPALPLLLLWRHLSGSMRRRRDRLKTVAALPVLLLLETWWSAGELVGYLTGRPADA